jgi:signal transduction histidine kinase
MKLNRIDVKLGVTIILLFLVVLLPLGFVIDQIFSSFYYNKVQEENEQLSTHYANILATNRNPMTLQMIEMMAQFSKINLYIVDTRGEILVSSTPWEQLPQGGQLVTKEELKILASGLSVEKMIKDPILRDHYLVQGKPVVANDIFYGGVYVFSSVQDIYQSIQKVRSLLILSGIGALFLALGFTFVISRKLSHPLIRMERATRKIAQGDLNTRVALTSKDEIGSLAQAINDLVQDLKRYRDTRREFFANISHELRTPMTYLEGYAKVLKEGMYQTEEEKVQYLTIIHQEAMRLTHLINDLFELSKMEEGKYPLNQEWIDLSEVIENITLKTGLKAKEKGLEIIVDAEDDLPLVFVDGVRIEQVFLNLMDNAIRYTENGTISLHLRVINEKEILVSIEDTGKGIPKEELPYIFERFYRVEKSRSREYGGTGLGLAIVKKLIELQGGEIQVFSQLGKGTRFEIKFLIYNYYVINREGREQ